MESLSEVREGAFLSSTFWRWLSVFASGEIVEPVPVVNGVVSGANVDLMLVGKGLCTMKMYTMTIKASAPRPKRAEGRFVPLVKFCRTPEFIVLAMVKILYKAKGWKSAKVGDTTCLVSKVHRNQARGGSALERQLRVILWQHSKIVTNVN